MLSSAVQNNVGLLITASELDYFKNILAIFKYVLCKSYEVLKKPFQRIQFG